MASAEVERSVKLKINEKEFNQSMLNMAKALADATGASEETRDAIQALEEALREAAEEAQNTSDFFEELHKKMGAKDTWDFVKEAIGAVVGGVTSMAEALAEVDPKMALFIEKLGGTKTKLLEGIVASEGYKRAINNLDNTLNHFGTGSIGKTIGDKVFGAWDSATDWVSDKLEVADRILGDYRTWLGGWGDVYDVTLEASAKVAARGKARDEALVRQGQEINLAPIDLTKESKGGAATIKSYEERYEAFYAALSKKSEGYVKQLQLEAKAVEYQHKLHLEISRIGGNLPIQTQNITADLARLGTLTDKLRQTLIGVGKELESPFWRTRAVLKGMLGDIDNILDSGFEDFFVQLGQAQFDLGDAAKAAGGTLLQELGKYLIGKGSAELLEEIAAMAATWGIPNPASILHGIAGVGMIALGTGFVAGGSSLSSAGAGSGGGSGKAAPPPVPAPLNAGATPLAQSGPVNLNFYAPVVGTEDTFAVTVSGWMAEAKARGLLH